MDSFRGPNELTQGEKICRSVQQVGAENTVIGYWDWVEYQIEQYHSDARCLAAPDQSAEEPSPALIRLINKTIRETFADTTAATDREIKVIAAVLKKLG